MGDEMQFNVDDIHDHINLDFEHDDLYHKYDCAHDYQLYAGTDHVHVADDYYFYCRLHDVYARADHFQSAAGHYNFTG